MPLLHSPYRKRSQDGISFGSSFVDMFYGVLSLNNECGQLADDKSPTFPWNVGIYLETQKKLDLICFGSIIHSNAVLTAAHCFCDTLGGNVRNNTFYIATGNLKKSITLKALPTNFQKISKNNVIINKYFKGLSNLFSNDIAIVKEKFQFGNGISPVCIDLSGFSVGKNTEGKQPVWDKTKVTVVDQTHISSEDCSYDVPESFASFVTDDKACTKVNAPNTHLTHTSEGSGLVFQNSENKRWYIKGVTSMNEPNEGKFSTYTSITQYLNWISNIYATL